MLYILPQQMFVDLFTKKELLNIDVLGAILLLLFVGIAWYYFLS